MSIENVEHMVQAMRISFYEKLSVKTGWGNVELKLVFEQAINDGLKAGLKVMDEKVR